MKQIIESIQKPRAKFSLINTGSKPKYTVRTIHKRVWMAGSSIYETGFKPQGMCEFYRYPPDDQLGILAL